MTDLRVAVTGAAGGVGAALVAALAAVPGLAPVALVRNPLQAVLLTGTGAEVRVGSVGEADDASRLLADCRAVVHCALATGPPRAAREANDAMFAQLAAHGAWEVSVHLSTVAVYGARVDAAASTFERPRPSNAYGRDKLRLETVAERALAPISRHAYRLRLGHVYGPGQNVTQQVASDLDDPSFALPFGGDLPSNAISIARLARVVIGLLTAPAAVGCYNLADGPMLTWRDVYARHAQAWGVSAPPALEAERSAAARAASVAAPTGLLPALGELVEPLRRVLAPARLARQPAFRGLVDAVRARAPERVEELARRVYTPRSMAAQTGALEASAPVSPRLLSDAMPGRFLDPDGAYRAGPSEAALDAALPAWYQQTRRFRWDPAEVGLDD